MMNLQVNGILGILILAAEVWAVISIFQSGTSNEKKTLWILLVIVLPLVGLTVWLFLGPRGGRAIRGA